MKYVEFRHLSAEIDAPEITATDHQSKIEKSNQSGGGVKSWLNSYFTVGGDSSGKSPKSDSEHEIVDFIKTAKTHVEEGKSYWMSDAAVKSCYNCDKEFSLTRRRHHCRFCGQIFCWKCAPQRSSPIAVRSCQKCLDQRRKSTISPPQPRRPSTSFFEEETADLDQLLTEFITTLPLTSSLSSSSTTSLLNPLNRISNNSSRNECEFDGLALSRWLSSKGLASEQMVKRLVEQNMIVVVNADQDTTTAIYRLVKKREDFVIVADETQELLDCALKDDTEDKMPQLIRDECLTCISPLLLEMSTMRPLEPIKVVDDETDDAIHAQHATETERLVLGDNHWHLAKMARQIAASIAPEAIRDAFDPRSLVHIKKHIVGGGVDSTQLYDGAALSGKVFTPPDWSPPSGRDLKVLLIDVPIEFRRDQTRLESLDDLLMQEAEWLSHCCARLVTRHPDVVFMAQSISHYAKQLLLKTGSVRVVTNVKPSALKRLQAATMGEVISTIEEIRTAKMGRTPHMSCLVQIGTEALIMVRSLLPGRQFSVLIKGANAAVLSSIQKCLAHLVLQAYQALCERAYFATRSRGRLDLAQHQQRHKECTCSSTTGGFTGRMLHSTKREVKLLDRAHLGDLSPMISIEPLAIDNAQIERRTDRTEHLLNNLQQSQQGQTKRHRFAIDPPLATEPHPFTATNTVLNEPDAEVAAADFRSRGSYPIVDHDQIRHNEEIEHGEMMASSYNGTLDKIYEYALAYSSYCLGREDTLLCAEPSVVPLVPYSSQDISLRQFIVQLGHGDLCAHCALPNRLHIRRMVYGGRALHVMFITSRAKLAEGEFITWGADQSRPSRVSPLLATMSVAAFLRLLLAPGTPDTIKTDMIRQTHYFATGHIICAIKPFPLATLSVESPTAQLTRDVERLWSLEPVRTELEELQTNGYALLEQIEKTQEKDEEFFDQAKGQFREAIEVVLVKYGEIRTKEMIEWGVLCDMYNQLGHLGQAVATINDKWLEIMKRVVHRQGGDETEEEIASEIVTDLPEIISTPLNYVNNLLHANKLSHERHFFPNDNSLLVFPIREDEPTSIYAHALANEQLLKASGDTSGAMVMALDAFLTCKIYHYAAFKRLRAAVGLGNDKDYITSIMRCTAWEAKGGKSGAKFYKSHDCRFVIKHIGAKEVKTIVEKGELYIDYMVNRSEKPSCLAKILGVFQVQMKQNETIKSHYIIMEDIFYGKTISKTYDLKGSRRNRMSKEEHIFLDSNYINQMRDHPVYIDKASQLILHNAIYNDADFLSSHSIIDYSLLVGVDEENDKLYIGIIDFIRTYTWDKKVEYEIKTHFTPGSTPPTILHPNKYKERFVESIKKYFNHSPNYYDRTLALKMPST